jgi:hypothetical protein
MKITYITPIIGEEQRSIAGSYTVQEYIVFPFKDCEVLYILGNVCLDTSCCGSGNWNYIQVIGYVLNVLKNETENHSSVFEIDTVENRNDQIAIRQTLTEKYPNARIEFR